MLSLTRKCRVTPERIVLDLESEAQAQSLLGVTFCCRNCLLSPNKAPMPILCVCNNSHVFIFDYEDERLLHFCTVKIPL